ncbi:MAG: DNA-binding response regulator [Verrucomicrobia bacterium]|nr:MAG: DNA-binding response regulator [Verrucomicrobiota bacterium]
MTVNPQNPSKPILISLVEDNAKLVKSLSTLINSTPDLRIHSTHTDAENALEIIPSAPPDIVLMDINLPGISGISCVEALATRLPKLRIVMLTAFENSDDIFASLAAGAHGYLLKSMEPTQLLDSIREVAKGGSPISGSVARKIVEFFRNKPKKSESSLSISPREEEVLRLLAEGYPYKQIADAMNLSMGTVRTYIERIYTKLHVHNRTEAVIKYFGR